MSTTLSRGGRLRLCRDLGIEHIELSDEERVSASAEDRVASVYPIMCALAHQFVNTLKPSERANLDVEDVVLELYTEVRMKDHLWTPALGTYTTWVGLLFRHLKSMLRDNARTVHSPRNSGTRMRVYHELEAEGRLTDRQRITSERILRTQVQNKAVDDVCDEDHPSDTDLDCDQASYEAALRSLKRGLAYNVLRRDELGLLISRYGLWGHERMTVPQIAAECRLSASYIETELSRIRAKLRDALLSDGHSDVFKVESEEED